MTTLLVDGDIVAYQAAVAAEQPIKWDTDLWTLHANESDGQRIALYKIQKAMEATGAENCRIYLTGVENFRKEYLPSYKGQRTDTRKPLILLALKDWLIAEHGAILKEPFEADDLLGIVATSEHDCIIMSEDKDLRTIPGYHFNPAKPREGVVKVSQEEADLWFMTQVLTGDTVDNFKGCPSVGPVKAQNIIQKVSSEGRTHDEYMAYVWQAVVHAYEGQGLLLDEAIVQARCARILRAEDIDDKGEIIPWSPPMMP